MYVMVIIKITDTIKDIILNMVRVIVIVLIKVLVTLRADDASSIILWINVNFCYFTRKKIITIKNTT